MSNHSMPTDGPTEDQANQDTAPPFDPTAQTTAPDGLDRAADTEMDLADEANAEYPDNDAGDETAGFAEVIDCSGVNLIYTEAWDIELQNYYPVVDEDGEQGIGVAALPLTVPELQELAGLCLATLEDLGALDGVGLSGIAGEEEDEDGEIEPDATTRRGKARQVARAGGGAIKGQWNTVANNPALDWSAFVELLGKRIKGVPVGWFALAGARHRRRAVPPGH